ncbi:MAG: hypothetical protein GF399_03605 [Candidatus Coatesbacteria bacterium]|nr:hypothetical protein [Candidatus Coatesbacteria bacterium]
MAPSSWLDAELERIDNDDGSGAAELYQRALLVAERLPPAELPELGRRLLAGRRDMAPLLNLGRTLREAADPAAALNQLRQRASLAQSIINDRGRRIIGCGRRIVTISRSSTVLRLLAALEPVLILCLHSGPGGEGLRAAKELSRADLNAELVADDDLLGAVNRAELALSGADKLTTNLFVNKVGTRRLAEALELVAKPLYVAADETKRLLPEFYEPPAPDSVFEEIPRSLVQRIITDGQVDRPPADL